MRYLPISGTALVLFALVLACGGFVGWRLDQRVKPISLEQQNRVLKLQNEAYKAALQWKMAELRRWEAGTDRTKFERATKEAIDAKASLDNWNVRINQTAEQIKKEDRCEKCIPTATFEWQPTPAAAR